MKVSKSSQDIKSNALKSRRRSLPLCTNSKRIKLHTARLSFLPPLPLSSMQTKGASSYQLSSNTLEAKVAVMPVAANSKPYRLEFDSSKLRSGSLITLIHTRKIMSIIFFVTGILLMFNIMHH